ncbi:hypothetical protein K443DRAFT_375583 [Laccaria amethystina LaAM-08-1]|uniref:Unplaced genomic scaffold K443scaffold_283, whole genome shotgun sequence n=1 Tax=Laccaria amethystina LaAM-08-1 TaxID=1095629 RepID=A0A0C9X8F5_9AGAR|nr:hypothetical protein K443DRAFT_375583 [Laccaria amethystina LaAM-08-1]
MTFECATLRILRSSIKLFVWTKKKKKKTARALCSAHGCKVSKLHISLVFQRPFYMSKTMQQLLALSHFPRVCP